MTTSSATPLLMLDDVGCTLGGVQALGGVDLTVNEGEILGIVGPNGAGKTTLFNAVTGYVAFDRGDVLWQGESLRGTPAHRIVGLGLVRTFQNAGGLEGLKVRENLAVAARTWRSDGLDKVVDLLGLADAMPLDLEDCSLATRKIVGIAMAVLQRPRMLLLDEPLAGLDLDDRHRVVEVIQDVHAQGGVTVVMIEHDIDRTLAMADRVAILDVGAKVAEGTPAELAGRSELHDVYLKA